MSGDISPQQTDDGPGTDVQPATAELIETLQVNTGKIIAIGTAGWAFALVVMLVSFSWIRRHGHEQWIWTCVVGVLLGLLGLLLIGRHRTLGRTK